MIHSPSILNSIFFYSFTLSSINNLFNELGKPKAMEAIGNCLDPVIPITQYLIYGTQKTNDFQDVAVAVVAGIIEDTSYEKTFDIKESSFFKASIKDSSKLICKNLTSNIGIKKPFSAFICEFNGLMTVAFAKQILSYEFSSSSFFTNNLYNTTLNFIKKQSPKASLDALTKIPASITKDFIKTSFEFDGANLLAEYAYRIVGNTGKYLITPTNTKIDDYSNNTSPYFYGNNYFCYETENQPIIGDIDYCPIT